MDWHDECLVYLNARSAVALVVENTGIDSMCALEADVTTVFVGKHRHEF